MDLKILVDKKTGEEFEARQSAFMQGNYYILDKITPPEDEESFSKRTSSQGSLDDSKEEA